MSADAEQDGRFDGKVRSVTAIWDGLSVRGRYAAILLFLLTMLAVPQVTDDNFLLNTFVFIFLFAIMGHGWNIIGGYAGQISLGHAIMFAAGAYTTTILFAFYNVTPLVGLWVGALVAALVGMVLGGATFRLRYHYFAMATLAAALIARVVFFRWDFVGGSTGIEYPLSQLGTFYSFTFREKTPYYYVTGAFLLVVTLFMYRLDRSNLGVYLKAINMDEAAAENAGINAYRYKLYAMGLSSFITGLAGGLYAQFVLYIDPMSTLRILRNIDIIMVAIVGGVGTFAGPVVGAAVFIPVREYSRTELGGAFTGLGYVFFGIVLLLISLYRPGGILNKYSGRWGQE